MTRLSKRWTLFVVLTCLAVLLGTSESAISKIDTSDLTNIWSLDFMDGNTSKKIKSISSMLDELAAGDGNSNVRKTTLPRGPGPEAPKTKTSKDESRDISGTMVELGDFALDKAIADQKIEEKREEKREEEEEEGINKRSYFPENVKRLEDLRRPDHYERAAVVSLLSKDRGLDLYSGVKLSSEYDFVASIVSISNRTEEMSAIDLFQGFVLDVDSICRISSRWFESYPRFVHVLRRTDDKISGKYQERRSNDQASSQRVRLSRRFTNDWVNFLSNMRTIVINSKSYRRNRRLLRKYKKIDHMNLEQYRNNIYNELQLFNHLLLNILEKLSFYIQYIVYFPNKGKLFAKKEDNDYLSQFKESYYKKLSNEGNLLKINRMDIYVNRIPGKTLKELRTSISSCSEVVGLLHDYGITPDSTPADVISLYLQYKRITRILLNIYSSEADRQFIRANSHSSSLGGPCPSSDQASRHGQSSTYSAFDQMYVPNKVGFRPFQTQREAPKAPSPPRNAAEQAPSSGKARAKLEFNYLSKESAEKMFSQDERDLFHLIEHDLIRNQLAKRGNFAIAEKRPSGASGLVIFSQKHAQSENGVGAQIMQNGQVRIYFNGRLLTDFEEKIIAWFKVHYFKSLRGIQTESSPTRESEIIHLEFKLIIACPHVISRSCMQNGQNCGINDVYMLVYLVGRLRGRDNDWKIVTEFNAITEEPRKQWRLVSILIPGIQSHLGGMCPIQASSLKYQALQSSKHVEFESPVGFKDFYEQFKYENNYPEQSILRNCLNYVQEGTTIRFSTNNGKSYDGVAICKDGQIHFY
ncbi:putative signal peptide-containing protein [Cryptosporidium canis]|uniref:Signal peptide-containing protein n=1 Tax=Cryptosporidium canis TaxID=195482 RepID=A0A9D5DHI4_9CRYT|nr:putative signal peptide-containing protein [Cryptosporidium canis]